MFDPFCPACCPDNPISTEEEGPLGTDEMDAAPQWAVVELMGHVRLVGVLSEETKFGTMMGRVDALQPDGSMVTQWFGGGSVYRITPTDEATARKLVVPPAAPRALTACVDGTDDSEYEDPWDETPEANNGDPLGKEESK
ncbi:MAG TPA: hypothetical protein PLL78_09370 [Fimbriimonadaceae bacterium]|nr:hypothetical protein [Fimbriimonadaceae bacterium]